MSTVSLYSDLQQFTGSATVIRHRLARRMCFTEGVAYLREHANAFWLIDAIASYFIREGRMIEQHGERFADLHFWELRRDFTGGATLTASEDSGFAAAITQRIEYTDFPFPETGVVKLFAARTIVGQDPAWVLMLPSEY